MGIGDWGLGQALMSASEAAEMIIRVDMTFTAPPRQRTDENSRPC